MDALERFGHADHCACEVGFCKIGAVFKKDTAAVGNWSRRFAYALSPCATGAAGSSSASPAAGAVYARSLSSCAMAGAVRDARHPLILDSAK